MSLHHLVYASITASVPAQRFAALARRLLARENASGPKGDPTSELANCLLNTFEKTPTARTIITSYLRECILQDLLSARHVVQCLLTPRQTALDDMNAGERPSFSGDDLETICNTIVTGLEPATATDMLSKDNTGVPLANSLAELLDGLTTLLPDVTEDRPSLSQVFTSLLSTIPNIDSLSDIDRERVASLRSRSRDVTSFSKTVLQELNLLSGLPDLEATIIKGPPQLRVTVYTEGEESDSNPPSSPDPWSTEERKSASNGSPNSSHSIQAPLYITFLVKDAIESLRNPTGRAKSTAGNSATEIPVSYKRIVHAAPEVSSRPLNFIYHLLCASFGLLVASIDDLQETAILEEQQSTSMMDTADEVMLNLNGGSSGEMSDSLKFAKMKELIARDGWKEWMWCFCGLLKVLQYWKSLNQDSNKGIFANDWQFPPSEQLTQVMEKFSAVNEQELERCDQMLRQLQQSGSVSDTSRTFTMMQLFTDMAEEGQLLILGDESSVQTGVEQKTTREFDTNLLNVEMSQFPGRFFETMMSPASWKGLVQQLLERIDDDVSLPDDSLTILTDCSGMLDLTSYWLSPDVLLNKVLGTVQSLDQRSRSSNDDPQTAFSTFGAWYLLAHAICVRFRLIKPELLRSCSNILNIRDLSVEDDQVLRGWIEALFGSSGIGDDLLHMTSPIKLLTLSTTVVSQAILAATAQVIDLETLRGGLSYFAQPLLSWCQTGIVLWLCQEIQRQGMYAHVYLDVLQALLEAGDLPPSILKATGKDILCLFEQGNGLELVLESSNIDIFGIQKKARLVTHIRKEGGTSFATQTVPVACSSVLRSILQSTRTKAYDIEFATPLYLLVKQVQSTGKLHVLDSLTSTDDTTLRRLMIVILSGSPRKGERIDHSVIAACQRIQQYEI